MLPVTSSSCSTATPSTSNEETMELKRKLAMVTEELSLNRSNHLKKIRAATALRGRLVIEIQDFPMQYYRVADEARSHNLLLHRFCRPAISLQRWFENFEKNPSVKKQPEAYHNWIQTRTVELLPKVLVVISSNLQEYSSRLFEKDLLSLRLVSKSWKQSVDQFLQDSVPVEPTICTEPTLKNIASVITSDNYQFILKMLGLPETKKHPGTLTPFPSGHLFIHCLPGIDGRSERAFNNALEILLEFYGETVQSFTFLDYRPKTDISWVSSWLKKMPNLKCLQIDIPALCSSQGDRLLIPIDFPSLPKLITFVGSFAPQKMTKKILSVNPQIRNLSLITTQTFWPFQLHLKSLSIQVSSGTQLLDLLGALHSPLEKFKLTYDLRGIGMDLEDVFQTLQIYGGALKELNLDLKVKGSSFCNSSLRLPKLQHLSVCLRKSAYLEKMSYDFLLPLESLEFLEIDLGSEEAHQSECDVTQVIQMYGYFHRMYRSNVWKLFPKLKEVDIIGRFGGCPAHRHFFYSP